MVIVIVFSQYDTIQIILLWEVTPKCYCLFRNECEKLNFFLNDALGKDKIPICKRALYHKADNANWQLKIQALFLFG